MRWPPPTPACGNTTCRARTLWATEQCHALFGLEPRTRRSRVETLAAPRPSRRPGNRGRRHPGSLGARGAGREKRVSRRAPERRDPLDPRLGQDPLRRGGQARQGERGVQRRHRAQDRRARDRATVAAPVDHSGRGAATDRRGAARFHDAASGGRRPQHVEPAASRRRQTRKPASSSAISRAPWRKRRRSCAPSPICCTRHSSRRTVSDPRCAATSMASAGEPSSRPGSGSAPRPRSCRSPCSEPCCASFRRPWRTCIVTLRHRRSPSPSNAWPTGFTWWSPTMAKAPMERPNASRAKSFRAGVGIPGMTARLRRAGGDLEIHSGPGGTRLHGVMLVQWQTAAAGKWRASADDRQAAVTGRFAEMTHRRADRVSRRCGATRDACRRLAARRARRAGSGG